MKRGQLSRSTPLKHGSSPMRKKPLGRASKDQRDKVHRQGCRLSGLVNSDEVRVDPAHIIPRAVGGCDDALCVVGLSRFNHIAYDDGQLDVLPHLTFEEQGHAAAHVGLIAALERTTGERWFPESELLRRMDGAA